MYPLMPPRPCVHSMWVLPAPPDLQEQTGGQHSHPTTEPILALKINRENPGEPVPGIQRAEHGPFLNRGARVPSGHPRPRVQHPDLQGQNHTVRLQAGLLRCLPTS